MKTPITVTAIWSRRIGETVETLAEVDGEWRIVCREYFDAPFSHIAEGNGADKWPLDPIAAEPAF